MKNNSISIFRNNDFKTNITVKFAGSNTPFDLTGCKVVYAIANYKNEEIIIYKEVSIHIDNSLGKSLMSFTKEELDIKVGKYKLEIRVIDSLGNHITFCVCELNIKETLIYERD